MEDLNRKIRIPLLCTPEEAKEIDDWQHEHRLRTRSAALRDMIRRCVDGAKAQSVAKPKKAAK